MFAQVIVESQQCLEPTFAERVINPVLPYCELFYYLSGVGLFVVAIIGLRQIALGRQIANLNAQRDALKVTADQCKLYADTIIPQSTTLREKTANIPYFESSSFSVEGRTITVNTKVTFKDTIPQLYDSYSDFVYLFNAIESFSQYLTSGLADEKNAYYCLGDVHLRIVSRYIPLLVLQAQEGNMWCYTLTLFVKWYNRQQCECIDREKQMLAQKKESLEKKQALYDEQGIRVLDVDSFCKCNRKKK